MVKYIRLDRYHQRFPSALSANHPLNPSNNLRISLQSVPGDAQLNDRPGWVDTSKASLQSFLPSDNFTKSILKIFFWALVIKISWQITK